MSELAIAHHRSPRTPHVEIPAPSFDVEAIRRDFPILSRTAHGKPLVYLDSAATAQKPRQVLEAITRFYSEENANVHRGVHLLSQLATEAYEGAREKVARFLNAADPREIVWVRGTTEAINLVAHGFGRRVLAPGDEILVTGLEHHSNIVPWQLLREEKGIVLTVVPFDDDGDVRLEEVERRITSRTRLVTLAHVSNALGTVLPVKEIAALAHARGIPVLVDGAQAVPHMAVDVQDLDVDFYALSGHKLFGPTGIGALYGKKSWLDLLPPWQGGGDMIASVSFEETTYNTVPFKFEAGTGDIAGAVGLGAAVDYVTSIGMDAIAAHDHEVLEYAAERLSAVEGLRIIGTAPRKSGVVSFVLPPIHPHDLGTVLDREGIAIRTGHHCAQPVMTRYGLAATARASFALYSTKAEVDALVAGVEKAKRMLG
jgi:cysteine desulfurase/selenocysteine lyase